MRFERWLSEPEAEGKVMNPLGGFGGFMRLGMRWGAFEEYLNEAAKPYAFALRDGARTEVEARRRLASERRHAVVRRRNDRAVFVPSVGRLHGRGVVRGREQGLWVHGFLHGLSLEGEKRMNEQAIDAAWKMAREVGTIEGNNSMRAAGRSVWSRKDLLASRKAEDAKLMEIFSDTTYTTPRRK